MYQNGSVDVTSTATLICSTAESGGVLIRNIGSASVYLGGSSVTSSGPTIGLEVAASSTQWVPSIGGVAHGLYAVSATSSTVVYLYPGAD